MMIITTYGEYISKSTGNIYQICGQNDPATGKRLWRTVFSKGRAGQSNNKRGAILYKGSTSIDIFCLNLCHLIEEAIISVPEGVNEGDFITQIGEKMVTAQAAGKFDEYMNSFIKEHRPKAREKL
jgi:hypothetical protein